MELSCEVQNDQQGLIFQLQRPPKHSSFLAAAQAGQCGGTPLPLCFERSGPVLALPSPERSRVHCTSPESLIGIRER